MRRALLLTGLLAASALPVLAQREPALKQIRLPHPYYYREMYLPQATSGPTSPCWSPDGRELAVSLQGSLWRIDLATGRARQVTNGPGYDYQPDWSPDARFLAYASYRDDAVELHRLELATRRSRPLTGSGAVSVEPRWSPDGHRLAFVSTAFEGRFHVFLVDDANADPVEPRRLTEDRDSGLPRYYYARHDHYLSPSWSPDGSELLLVSNRGRIWGTGGFWRMRAEPGAPMREVHQEETTWKARPDWARDGRVVYASYLGRAWHQLWVTRADGGDAFPLTYGDFDATAPRWSPDGTRIAYVSNEDGDTALWILEWPGGRRKKLELRERERLGPVARLRVEVADGTSGQPMPARVSVTAPDGRSFAPDDAWRHADDGFDRAERRIEYGYFHTRGVSELVVPAGAVTVEALRGVEWVPARQTLELAPDEERTLRLPLRRLVDMRARGWAAADLHVHMNYGGAYRASPATLLFQALAEGLHVVENLIVNKEQRVPDMSHFTGGVDPASTAEVLLRHSQEFHTSFWGHMGLLGLTSHVLVPDYAAYVNTAASSPHPMNVTVADLAREQGALVGYVHPFDAFPDPEKEPLSHELPVGVALGKVDYYEVVGFSDHLATSEVYHRLLSCGFRVAAGAGTDAMTNFASLRGPVGLNRTYVRIGPTLDYDRYLEALKAGRTIATNGPLVELALRTRGSSGPWSEPGDELRLPPGVHELELRVSLRSIVPVDHLEIVGNGKVVASVPLTGARTAADMVLRLPVRESGFYLLRGWSERARHPVLDLYPYGTTGPIWVTVGGAEVRSVESARYFLDWMDRVRAAAEAHPGWASAAEKNSALETIARARAVWAEKARPR